MGLEGVAACKHTTTPTISSECPRCGIITKSGRVSCCGRGGSWFKNCGRAGNTQPQHTWYEGIQSCKARSQSKAVIDQQLNGAQQKDLDSSQGVGNKAVITTIKTSAFTSVNTSTPMPDRKSIITSTYTPANVSITTATHTSMSTISTNTFMIPTTDSSIGTVIITRGYLNRLSISIFCLSLYYS